MKSIKIITIIAMFIVLSIFIAGCNGLIYPVSYEVNIHAFDKNEKNVFCDSKTIKIVDETISRIASKYGYTRAQGYDLVTGKKYDFITCFYLEKDTQRAMFFRHKNYHIEIRGDTKKKETHKLGEEILRALEKKFPEYKFRFEAKWIRQSILS